MVATKAADVSIARLPATGGDLFGREAELAWLDACWAERAHVAIVVAWGGVGKSALVNTWLSRMRDAGWRGAERVAERVYGWSFYSQGTDRLTSSDAFVDAALRWFGDGEPEKGSPWDKGELLARLVRERRAILVLDGVEPLQWGPGVQAGRFKDPALEALVKELAAQNDGLCLLTTRIAVTDLDALAGDKVRAKDLGRLSTAAGAELLAARGAKGAAEELRAAAEEYDGHGLALTLLGSYLEDVAEGDIQRRKEIGPLLVDERQGGHARRVMAAYELWLGKPEVAILRVIGLFDRPVEPEEIAALRADPPVAGLTDALAGVDKRAWNKAVARLGHARLLSVEGDRRLDAHPLVREHFGERLKQEQPAAWREGHRRLYEHLRATAKELPETLEEMAPLYAAVAHGCRAGKNGEARSEVLETRIQREKDYFNTRKLGAYGSELAVLSAFFDPPWERLAPGLNANDGPIVLAQAGFALRALGRLPEAARLMRTALAGRIAQKNWKDAAVSASNLSDLLQANGELREALAQARESVELADKSGDVHERVLNRSTRAAVLHAMGLRGEAAAQLEEVEGMQSVLLPAYPLLRSVQGFRYCDLLLDYGREADVRKRAANALERGRGVDSLLEIALDHLSLGRAHLLAAQRGAAGDLAQAASHLNASVDRFRHSGDQSRLPLGLLARASLHTYTRAVDLARKDLAEALTLSTRCGFRLHEADAHLGYARLHLVEGHPAPALSHLAKARALITATGYHRRDRELDDLDAEAATMAAAQPAEPLVTTATPTPAPPAPRIAKPMPDQPAPHPSHEPVDFFIFAPLEEERNAVLSKLPGHRRLDSDGTDVHVYFEAKIATNRDDKSVYRVLVTSPAGMGPIHAAVTASAIASRWQPEHVIVVGIAGGLKDEVAVGDVMVARFVADYTVGKVEDDSPREERWEMYAADAGLLNAANASGAEWHDLITAPRPKGNDRPARHAGVIASGGDVVASKAFVATYRKDMPKLIGLEMEGGGVATALHGHKHRPRFLMVRGVSDLADGKGNAKTKKQWRAYARDVAAAYVVGLLRDGPVPAAPRSHKVEAHDLDHLSAEAGAQLVHPRSASTAPLSREVAHDRISRAGWDFELGEVMAAVPSVTGAASFYALEHDGKGVVYCHASGERCGEVFHVRKGIGWYYQTDLRGAASRLGLPVSHEEPTKRGATCRFEAGHIEWEKQSSWARAYLGSDPANAVLLHEKKL